VEVVVSSVDMDISQSHTGGAVISWSASTASHHWWHQFKTLQYQIKLLFRHLTNGHSCSSLNNEYAAAHDH
jgi:hypothetical protein